MVMKPLICGMGPSRLYETDPWHPKALSTVNLCRLITGTASGWGSVERHFDMIDLNASWYWLEGVGDAIQPDEAEATLRALITRGGLRGGRKMFLLGEQVTNFVFGFLRCDESSLVANAWRSLPKCAGVRLRTDDCDARSSSAIGYYDFTVIPLWHPRILLNEHVKMPPGWQQRMMNAMRSAGGLPPMKFNRTSSGDSCAGGWERNPNGLQLPIW